MPGGRLRVVVTGDGNRLPAHCSPLLVELSLLYHAERRQQHSFGLMRQNISESER